MSFAPTAQLWIDRRGRCHLSDRDGRQEQPGDPIEALERFVREAPPFCGEARAPHTVGFLGYDLATLLEPHLATRPRPQSAMPLAYFARYESALSFASREDDPDDPVPYTIEAVDRAAAERFARALFDAEPSQGAPGPRPPARLLESPSWSEYRDAVARALDYIAAGDVYQVNLARRFRVATALSAGESYLRWRAEQAVPFGAFLDCGEFSVLSNSPERFLRVKGHSIFTEPIKGTRRRHADPAVDLEFAAGLRTDPKECAEHVMIVDLERNDLGRICETGSVHVPSFARVESFATLHHLVSTVEGRLNAGVGLADILRASFPSGSITGAPKIRASEVIAELEPHGRGLYTGAFFSFRSADDFDSSILIRTAISRDGLVDYHAGGGIVADSDPQREYAECWLKARAFLSAILDPGREKSRRRRSPAGPEPARRAETLQPSPKALAGVAD